MAPAITICCQNRQCLFGEIDRSGEMTLNDAGSIANECWLDIPNHFPNAILHEHIVMPNHIHGIIELNGAVGVENFQPQRSVNEFQKIIAHSIGCIVRGFKIGVTKWMHQNTHIRDVWQRNYYEHIIRDEQSYMYISQYIIDNPAKWGEDKFYLH